MASGASQAWAYYPSLTSHGATFRTANVEVVVSARENFVCPNDLFFQTLRLGPASEAPHAATRALAGLAIREDGKHGVSPRASQVEFIVKKGHVCVASDGLPFDCKKSLIQNKI